MYVLCSYSYIQKRLFGKFIELLANFVEQRQRSFHTSYFFWFKFWAGR